MSSKVCLWLSIPSPLFDVDESLVCMLVDQKTFLRWVEGRFFVFLVT